MYLAFIFDGGHIYTTYAESLCDINERILPYVKFNIFFAFVLNLLIALFAKNLFFQYIFYYTVYHNMRQGLGVSIQYNKERNKDYFKMLYYLVTLIPFVVYHFIDNSSSFSKLNVDQSAKMNLNLSQYKSFINLDLLFSFYYVIIFLITIVMIYRFIKYKDYSYLSLLFFGLVYYSGFIFFKSLYYSYAILIFSHGIPYIFIMESRIKKTHSSLLFRNNSYIVIIIFIIIGILVESQNVPSSYSNNFLNALVMATFWTPTIAHFTLDSEMWKHTNLKFQTMIGLKI
jgi:hypothetical protein